jgi:hypothetical protein
VGVSSGRGRPGLPSARLAGLVGSEMSGFRRETGEDGRVRFVPVGDGPVLELASRVEKRFLGRTEIAVFRVPIDLDLPEETTVAVRHTGGLKRTGVTAVLVQGGEPGERVASALAADAGLAKALLPLDFTRFEIFCEPAGCRVEVELMGATHVAIALPPIRSYIHLYPDQLEAMIRGLEEVRRVVGTV